MMINGGALYVIPFLTGVEGADLFNFFFSLVTASGLLVFIPACCMKLIQRA